MCSEDREGNEMDLIIRLKGLLSLVAVDKILPFAFALICTPMKSFLLHLSSNELPQRLIPLCLTEILLQLCPYCNELLCLLVTPLRDTFLLLASPAQCHGPKVAPSYIR